MHGNVVGNDILPVSRCYMYMFTAHYKADLITSSRYPLFAFTPIQSGGLGLSEAKIGVHMTIRSLNQIIVMFSFAPLHKWLGTARSYQLAMVFWLVAVAVFSALNTMARRGALGTVWFDIVLGVFFTTWSFAAISWSKSFTAYPPCCDLTTVSEGGWGIVVTDAAPSADTLSAVNVRSNLSKCCLPDLYVDPHRVSVKWCFPFAWRWHLPLSLLCSHSLFQAILLVEIWSGLLCLRSRRLLRYTA